MLNYSLLYPRGFPDSSVGKESACNAGDPGSIPGLGRSAGEGIGYPLQYSGASLVAQLVKNLPAMRETLVGSLGWEDPLEKPNPVFWPGEFHGIRVGHDCLSISHPIIHLKVSKRLVLDCSHVIMCSVIEVFANAALVIILEHINDSNQHIGHLKLTCYISHFKKKQKLQNNNAGNKHG